MRFSLEDLDISNCPAITAYGLHKAILLCKRLHTLSVASCPHITKEVLNALFEQAPSLSKECKENCMKLATAEVVDSYDEFFNNS